MCDFVQPASAGDDGPLNGLPGIGTSESWHSFGLLMDCAPIAMVFANSDGKIVLVNVQTEKLFGYDRRDLLGQPLDLLVPARFRPRHSEYLSGFFVHPETRSMGKGRDLFGLRKDETEFPVEIGLNPIRTDDGLLVLSAIVDITERKRAEGSLRRAHEELEARVEERTSELAQQAASLREQAALLDLAKDAIMVRGMDGEITFWNRGAEDLYGWTRAEAGGKISSSLLQTVFPQPLAEIIAEVQQQQRWEGTLSHVRRDGTLIEVASRWSLKKGLAGEPDSILEINNDITERQHANERLEQLARNLEGSNRELATANQELEAFSYSVSHDLRAPLRAIDGFSRILLGEHAETLTPDGRDCLQEIRDNTRRMGNLVDDLLTFSRLSRQPLNRQRVNSTRLVRQCLEELSSQREGRRVDVSVGDLPVCRADPTLLKQVWINLLSNALKYTGSQDLATIEVGSCPGENPDDPTYFVKDNGVGFDMRYAHKLFGVFQRLHRTEDYEGTGVGLAIVQRIVVRHGGRVWADASPGQGATFFFTISGEDPQ